mmetsp:Transcript_18192/g.44651  ORF Transcript_18192/g.44651 Transcript_18192/m.44651 type:complete len:206 (-) Transcript_18192:698-1315(-)
MEVERSVLSDILGCSDSCIPQRSLKEHGMRPPSSFRIHTFVGHREVIILRRPPNAVHRLASKHFPSRSICGCFCACPALLRMRSTPNITPHQHTLRILCEWSSLCRLGNSNSVSPCKRGHLYLRPLDPNSFACVSSLRCLCQSRPPFAPPLSRIQTVECLGAICEPHPECTVFPAAHKALQACHRPRNESCRRRSCACRDTGARV